MVNADDVTCANATIPMPASTPTSQFSAVDGFSVGVILDKKSGLMWERCTHGHTWNEGSCDAPGQSAEYKWQDALQEVVSVNDVGAFGYNDWRLPNLKELASIIERKCTGVSINSEIFPGVDTSFSRYWTNTHLLGSTEIKIVDFSGGVVGNSVTNESLLHLRMVRDYN